MSPHPSSLRFSRLIRVALLALLLAGGAARAQSVLPSGGHVVAGSATIGAPAGNSLSITQTTPRAVVNWNGFSVGQPNTVIFSQPGSSAAILNRVTGSTPSTIAGQIDANGQVYLVNPNGVAITPTGSVQVGGGFVASTLGISNQGFMGSNLNFQGNGTSAPVGNAGTIAAGPGGFVGLIGGTAANSGVISVPLGKVALGSGEAATLDLNGGGFLQVAVPTGATTAEGQALVSNSGRVNAAGGTVELRAATVATAIRDAVNMGGTIAANSVSGQNGSITLSGGPGGAVNVTGTLDASAPPSSGANGGSIAVAGAKVQIGHHAILNASGAKGGSVLVGVSGPGGQDEAGLTVIADGATILATGEPGQGGSIETSGGTLKLGRALIDAGIGGLWLTDPLNLTIDATAATTIDTALNAGTNVTETTTATTASGSGTQSSGAGDIDVTSALSWSTAATLTLNAYNNINISAPITISGGDGTGTTVQLNLEANNNITVSAPIVVSGGAGSGGTVVITYNNAINGGNLYFVMGQGSLQFTGGSSSGAELFINNDKPPGKNPNGTQYTLIYSLGSSASGMEDMGASGNYALAIPIDASTDSSVTLPLTTALVGSFSGDFNGLGNTISNLRISGAITTSCPLAASAPCAGLFGQLNSGGTISNLGLVGGSIIDSRSVAVDGELVGASAGTIVNSYATGSVSGGNDGLAGGLVGYNSPSGTITTSYATGAVSNPGTAGVIGGLAGQSDGTISNSYATGAVTGAANSYVGGLVGAGAPGYTILDSFAMGFVSGGGGGGGSGGLIGGGGGTITGGYYNSSSTNKPHGTQSNGSIGLTTAELAGGLPSGFSPTVWGNVNNQVTPYILTNPGPVMVSIVEGFTPLYTLVFTPTQLQAIGSTTTTLAGDYVLAQDIDMTGVDFTEFGTFTGGFNGLGNVVANLTLNNTAATNTGLFSTNDGSIVNLGLVNATVSNTGTTDVIGGLVGENEGQVAEAYFTGTVTGAHNAVGGLIGQNDAGGSVTNAYAVATVNGGGANVGGLIGNDSGSVSDSYAQGPVGGSQNVGGLVGSLAGSLTQVYSAGSVVGNFVVGGLVGDHLSGTITGGYWDADRAAASMPSVGSGSSTGATAVGEAYDTSPFAAHAYGGFNFTSTPGRTGNNWVMIETDGTLATNGSTAIAGTMPMLAFEAQSVIQNAHQLQLMAMNLSGSYTLGRSIDASNTGAITGKATGNDVWGCALPSCTGGFVPIGGFSGTLNGAGNTISNPTINSALGDVGLVGSLGGAGTIENLGLVGGSVTGTTSSFIGALVGNSSGNISNDYATTAVTDTVSGATAGGLVGNNSGTITMSYANGSVTGDASGTGSAGGLVGYNVDSITLSFAAGAVTGYQAGGLVGRNQGGTISDVYAVGPVTTSDFGGGLVGVNTGTITNAYATGAQSNPSGGLLGFQAGTTNTSYWDTGTTGAPHSSGGTPETTAMLQAALPATFSTTNWGIVPGKSYPYLCWQALSCLGTPQVVSGTVYQDVAGTTNAGAGITVSALGNGNALASIQTLGTVATGANGYYYYLLAPNTIVPFDYVLTYAQNYTAGSGTASGAALSNAGGTVTGLNILANTLHAVTSETAYSAVVSDLDTADQNATSVIALVNGLTNLQIDASGATFAVDAPISYSGMVTLNSAGTLSEDIATITAGTLAGRSVGTTNLNTANAVSALGSFAVTGGDFTLTDGGLSGTLTVNGPVTATNITISGPPAVSVAGTVAATTTARIDGVAVGVTSGGNVTGSAVLLNAAAGGIALTGTAAVGSTGGTVDLDSSGTISEDSTSTITAGTLQSSGASGTTELLGTGNAIAHLGNFAMGSGFDFGLVDSVALTITGNTTTSGVSMQTYVQAPSIAVSSTGTLGSDTSSGRVSLRTDAFSLTSGGAINAATIELAPNTIGGSVTLGATGSGLSLTSLSGIQQSNVHIGGVTPPQGSGPATTAGSIAITGAFAVTGFLQLDATGAVTQTAPLTATVLGGTAGSIALLNTGNSFGVIEPDTSTGDLSVYDSLSSLVLIQGTAAGNAYYAAPSAAFNSLIQAGGTLGIETDSVTATGDLRATTVEIAPLTSGTAVTLGGTGSGLSLASFVPVSIFATTLRIGAVTIPGSGLTTTAGSIAVAGAFGKSSLGLDLDSQGAITESAGALTASTLSGGAAGNVTLLQNNLIGALGAFTVTGGTGNGLALVDGSLLTVSGAASATGNVFINDSVGVEVGATGSVGAGSGQTVSFETPAFAIETGGTVSAGAAGTFELAPNTGTAMFLGASGFASPGSAITAGIFRLGAVTAPGASSPTTMASMIEVTSPGFSVGGATLELETTGSVAVIPASPTPAITAGSLLVFAGQSVDLPGANMIGTLAADVTGAGYGFDLSNAATLTIGTVGGTSGVTTNGTDGSEANIVLQTTAGDIDIEAPVSTNGGNGSTLGLSLGQIGLQAAGNIYMNQTSNTGQVIGFAVEAVAGGSLGIALDGAANGGPGNRIGGNDVGGIATTSGTFSGETSAAGSGLTFTDSNAPLTIDTVTTTGTGGVAAGSITLPPLSGVYTNGGTIYLDSQYAGGSSTFGLTLNQPVNANNFVGGNPTTTLQGTPGLVRLYAEGGDLTQTSTGVIIGGQLYAEADGGPNYDVTNSGSVVLTAENRIGADDVGGIARSPGIAGRVAGFANGNFQFINDNAPLTIDTLTCGCGGVFTVFGDIDLATTGAGGIAVNAPLNAGNNINIAVAPTYGFTNSAGNFDPSFSTEYNNFVNENSTYISSTFGLDATAANGSVTVLADQMSLANGTIGAGLVLLGPVTQANNIALGAAGSSGTLGLRTADLANVESGAVQIGYRNPDGTVSLTGNITISNSFSVNTGNIEGLLLVTGGSVGETGSGAIVGTGSGGLQLGILASGANSLTGANDVETLAAYIDGTSPSLSLTNSAALKVGTLSGPEYGVSLDSNGFPAPTAMSGAPSDPLRGIVTTGGLTLTTTAGGITVNSPISTGAQPTVLSAVGAIAFDDTVTTTGALSATAGSDGGSAVGIAQNSSGVLRASGGATFSDDSSGGTITLGDNNSLHGTVSLNTIGSGGNASLVNVVATTLGASTLGGNLTLSVTGGLTVDGAVTSPGTITLAATPAETPVTMNFASGANVSAPVIDLDADTIALTGTAVLGQSGATIDLDSPATTGTTGAVTEATSAQVIAGTLEATKGLTGGASLVGTANDVTGLSTIAVSGSGNGFTLVTASPLSVNGALSTASGPVSLVTSGTGSNLTLAEGATVSGSSVVLATPAAFVNAAGSGAVTATGSGSRWLIYSAAPTGDTFGNLDSGDTAIWGETYATLPPASVTQSGNRYLFAQSPTLTVTTTSDSKTYGIDATAQVASDYTVSSNATGVANAFLGDNPATVYTGTPSVTSAGSAPTATVAGGPYQISAAAGTMTALDGYTLSFADSGTLSVTPATLTAALAGTVTKVYDGLNTASLVAGNYTLTGILSSDAGGVSLNDPTTGTYATANAGTGIGVSVSGLALTGTAAGNYTLASATANAAIGTITPAGLTAAIIGNPTKTYDGRTVAPLASGNFVLTGFVTGQGASVSPVDGIYAMANAGTGIGVSATLTSGEFTANGGTSLGNYTLPTSASGTGTITPAALTAAITGNPTKIYDGTTAAPLASGNFALSGFVTGQGATVSPVDGAFATANAGTGIGVSATLTSGEFTANGGTSLGNYTLPTSASGTGTITPAALTAAITANPTKVYDGTTTAPLGSGNFALTGFVTGQGATVSAVSGTYNSANVASATTVTAGLRAGDFTATGSTILSNYMLPTTATGTGTITPAALTAAITGNPTKIYDGTTTASLGSGNFALSGFVGSNGATVSAVSGTYNSANVASATTVTAGLGAGDFTATGSTILSNYMLPTTATGAGTITPATVTASIVGSPTKIYNATTTASLGSGNFGLSGFVGTDGATVSAVSGNYNSANVATATTVSATLTSSDFTAAGTTILGNYTLPTSAAGAGTITPAALTVTANDATRPSGQANPPLTYTLTSGSLLDDDTLSGALATSAGTASPAGTYPITEGTLGATPNYTLSFVDGTLTVTAANIVFTRDNGVSPLFFINPWLGYGGGSKPGFTTCPAGSIAALLNSTGHVDLYGGAACGND